MRSAAMLSLVTLLSNFGVAFVATSDALGSESRYQHSQAVLDVVERQCVDGTHNSAFCDCVIEALNMYLPPEYASLIAVSPRRRTYQFFELHPDTPRYIEDQLDDETTYCREEFASPQ